MLKKKQICVKLKTNEWKVYRDDTQKVPYAVKGRQWIGFDDVQSIKDKLAFLKSRKLGGAVAWSIDTEDFNGVCGAGKNPLMKTISGELNGITGPDPVIHEVHVTKDPHQTTPDPSVHRTTRAAVDHGTTKRTVLGDFKCVGAGYFADPKDRTIFHQCIDIGNGKHKDFVIHCPTGLVYDDQAHICRNG